MVLVERVSGRKTNYSDGWVALKQPQVQLRPIKKSIWISRNSKRCQKKIKSKRRVKALIKRQKVRNKNEFI